MGRRLACWTLNALTVLSMLLCVATTALWAQSRASPISLTINGPHGPWRVSCARGAIDLRNPTTRPIANAFENTIAYGSFYREYEREHPFSGQGPRPTPSFPKFSVAVERSHVQIPFGRLLATESGMLALALLARPIGYRKGDAQPRCRRCGYDLTGNLSDVCPECGTATESKMGEAS